MTALEDRTVPTTVTIAALGDLTEGGSGGFVLTRDGDFGTQQTVFVSVGGTATPGQDFAYVGSQVTFQIGFATANVTLTSIDDSTLESTETVTLTIMGGPYTPGTPASATINILDNDPPVPVIGSGTGLFGRYYVGKTFEEVRVARIDSTVNFNWGLAGPVAGVGTDEFSVRWTGKMQASYAGTHTISTETDDGVRLWVNGVLKIDEWHDQGPPNMVRTFQMDLVAGEMYDIKMEYHDNLVYASAKLSWSNAFQTTQVIPTSQLYSNTSTVGDRAWLDADGNGRQDAGEAGVAGVKVRLLDAAGALVVPAATTDANGNYSLVVPADDSYQLKFGKSGAQYAFTQPLAWEADVDSDAGLDGMTALFTTPAAGASNLHLDAGLVAVFDLDVNANGSLSDAVDGAATYLPGYEGNVQKVSTGGSFNTDTYTGQHMKLVVDGIGLNSANVTKVDFVVTAVSTHAGYASNRSHASVEAANEDYSFHKTANYRNTTNQNVFTITRTTTPGNEGGGPSGGQMEAAKTWIHFYAKDYGGSSHLEVRVYVSDGAGGEVLDKTLLLRVPRDDGDGLADRWEVEMADRWATQYGGRGITGAEALTKFVWIDDEEMRDPDGTGPTGTRPLVSQNETGDAHEVLEEYRGYILDGGGLDGAGANGHAGGHIRLDPARKEILVEVDRAATLNNVPGTGTLDQKLTAILNGAASVFSHATRGAGIYMYWLFDEVALNLPRDKIEATFALKDEFKASRDTESARNTETPNLTTDFIHLLLGDDNGGFLRRCVDQRGSSRRTWVVGRGVERIVGREYSPRNSSEPHQRR